jgi:hypothetical protein
MNENTELEAKPPYVAYKTFSNLIASLRESGLPNRIDRSVLSGMSGASQSYVMSAFKFLGLVSVDGVPTALLKQLVTEPKNEKVLLSAAVKEKYDFIFHDHFNITAATEAELEEKFREKGLSGETIRKSISFLTMICEATGIAISPHLKSKRGPSSGNGVTRRYKKRKGSNDDEPEDQQTPPSAPQSLQDKLLAKFPEFDPKWDAEMQKTWFATFEQFMKSAKAADGSAS